MLNINKLILLKLIMYKLNLKNNVKC